MKPEGRKLLIDKLKTLMVSRGVDNALLMERSGMSRSWIKPLLANQRDFGVDWFEDVLTATFNLSLEDALYGPDVSKIPRDLYWLLDGVLKNGDTKLIEGLRTTLNTYAETARLQHLKKQEAHTRRHVKKKQASLG